MSYRYGDEDENGDAAASAKTIEIGKDTSCFIPGLSNGTEYFVKVRAGNSKGWSENWSEEKSGMPDVMTPPPMPRGLMLDNQQPRSLAVSWDEVIQPGAKIRYKVAYSKTEDESAAALADDNISDTSTVITNLDGDTLYYVWVSAGNKTGFGPSAKASAMVLLNLPPIQAGAPTGRVTIAAEIAYEVGGSAYDGADYGNGIIQTWLGQTNASKDKSYLSGVIATRWASVEGATAYNVYVATSDSLATVPPRPANPLAETSRLAYFVRDCTPDLYYFIWVQAKNDKGGGPFGTPYTGRVESARNQIQINQGWNPSTHYERAGYPKDLRADVIENGSVRLSWEKSDRATWYEVYYSENLDDVRVMTGGVQSKEIIGQSWSEGSPSQGNRRLVPYLSLAYLNPDFTAKAIPWNDRAGKAGNPGEVYKIYSLETTVTGLDPAKRYFFVVRGLNHNGERGLARIPDSANASDGLQPVPGGVPSFPAPVNVQVNPVSPGGGGMLKVSWDAVAGAASYRVYYSKYPAPALNLPFNPVSGGLTTTTTIVRLDENHIYYVWVVAISASNELSPFSEMKSGVPNYKDGTEPELTNKITLRGEPLKTHLYIEVNDTDPRVALGYELENSGVKFFDQVVIFAANIRTRNCATEGSSSHRCTKSGLHLHYNGNVQYILENRNKYIKPLQDAGIKVLLGTLPDHDNVTYHSFGPWPFEENYPWTTPGNRGVDYHAHWWKGDPNVYPLSDEGVINGFIEELCSEIERFGLDGFDIDDEWYTTGSNIGVKGISALPSDYGAYWSSTMSVAMAENIANFLYRARVRFDAGTPAGQDKKIIAVYDYGAPGATLGASGAQFGPAGGKMDINPNIWNYVSCSGYSMYGGIKTSRIAGIPRMQYSPYAVGFHNMQGPGNANTYTDPGADGDWGYMLFYDLRSHAAKGSATSQLNLINRYAKPIFGQDVVYVGPDYPQDWSKW